MFLHYSGLHWQLAPRRKFKNVKKSFKVLRKISHNFSFHINVSTAVPLSSLSEIGENIHVSQGVGVQDNSLFLRPFSSSYDERPVHTVYSAAPSESLRVMRDVNI